MFGCKIKPSKAAYRTACAALAAFQVRHVQRSVRVITFNSQITRLIRAGVIKARFIMCHALMRRAVQGCGRRRLHALYKADGDRPCQYALMSTANSRTCCYNFFLRTL